MPRALPLAPFIGALSPQALQAGNQTTLESIYGQLGLDPRKLIGTTNSPLGPIRGLSPSSIPPGPRYMGVTVPGNYGVGGQGQLMEAAGQPGMGGLLSAMMQAQQKPGSLESPVQAGPQPPGNWDLQNMGELPPAPVYPHVQPGVYPETAQNQYTPQQPTPQPPIVPRGTSDQQLPPWSYTPPAQTQQPQQGGISDAGMWGLIAAGLGILGNNYGNYGQWSPAVGKGGLIGVQTYLGQRQQAIENQAQQQRLGIASREQAAREQLYGAQMGNYQSEAELRQQQIENMKALRDAYSGILGEGGADQAKLMSDPNTHYAVAARLLRAGNASAAKQAMDSGLALEKQQEGKWKTVMVPHGDGTETPMQVDEQGNTRPIKGAGSRPVFNPSPLVQVSPQLIGERAEFAGEGTRRVKVAERYFTEGETAMQGRQDIRTVQALMPKTGAAATLEMNASNWAKAFGLTKDEMDNAAKLGIADTLLSDRTFAKQAELKGQTSDRDMLLAAKTYAQITNPEAKFKFLLDYKLRQSELIQQRATFFHRWREDHGGSYEGAERAWWEHAKDINIMDDPTMKKYLTPEEAASKPAPSGKMPWDY